MARLSPAAKLYILSEACAPNESAITTGNVRHFDFFGVPITVIFDTTDPEKIGVKCLIDPDGDESAAEIEGTITFVNGSSKPTIIAKNLDREFPAGLVQHLNFVGKEKIGDIPKGWHTPQTWLRD